MADINASYLEYRLSGGASNTDPDLSLGGVISSEVIASQTATGISTVTGVTALFAAGNAEGAGTLTYIASTKSLRWTPPGGALGPAVAIPADGNFALFGAADVGQLNVSVVYASLAVADHTDAITIANVLNEVYDDISKADSFNGSIDYRCYYLKNTHPTQDFLDAVLFIGAQPSPGSVSFGKEAAGVGDGVTTGVAQTVATELTAPTGITFSLASSEVAGQSIGPLLAGESIAVWVRRTLAARNTVANPESFVLVNVQLYY